MCWSCMQYPWPSGIVFFSWKKTSVFTSAVYHENHQGCIKSTHSLQEVQQLHSLPLRCMLLQSWLDFWWTMELREHILERCSLVVAPSCTQWRKDCILVSAYFVLFGLWDSAPLSWLASDALLEDTGRAVPSQGLSMSCHKHIIATYTTLFR